eukprot:13610632-Ditylum_brightwellii.AAC.1
MASSKRSTEAKGKQVGKKTYVHKDWEAYTQPINWLQLRHVVQDAGSNLFGVIVLEVWMLPEDQM